MKAEIEAKEAKYAEMDAGVEEASNVRLVDDDEDDEGDYQFSDGDDWDDGGNDYISDEELAIDGLKDNVLNYFLSSAAGKEHGKGMPIGKLTTEGRTYLETLSGMTMREDVDFVLNPSDLRHIYNNHFGPNEKDKGNNSPLTDDDIRMMVDVIRNPERVVYGINKKTRNKVFMFLLSNPSGTYNLAEVYTDRRGNLTAKSYYNTKKTISQRANELLTNSPHLTSATDGASSSLSAKVPILFQFAKENEKNLSDDMHFSTSDELFSRYPGWLEGQTRDDGRHSTQIPSTVNSYRHIGDWMLRNGMGGVSVLDASSGLGNGTKALREMGFDVDDVEPYPSENRDAPTYLSYDDIDRKYDVVISNAVLNVIPDDWRRNVLHLMASKVKDGGRMIINVREAGSISKQKQKIELDSPSEILVTDKKGNITAYQRGFTPMELREYVSSELGEGWDVVVANQGNSGPGSGTAVVATRNGGSVVEDSRDDVRSAIEETASTFGEDVELIDDVSSIKNDDKRLEKRMRNAKGWLNTKTGRISVVVPNNRSIEEAVGTILHEATGHKGLRDLFGDDFDVFLDNVYNNVEEDIRERIDRLNKKKGGDKDRRDATEEYLSRLAEDGKEFEELERRGVWQKIKDWFMDLLRKQCEHPHRI